MNEGVSADRDNRALRGIVRGRKREYCSKLGNILRIRCERVYIYAGIMNVLIEKPN
jgi:hypothetical protein